MKRIPADFGFKLIGSDTGIGITRLNLKIRVNPFHPPDPRTILPNAIRFAD